VSWADPTKLSDDVYECATAADPNQPGRLLTIGRVQRPLHAGEDEAAARRATGCPLDCPPGDISFYKNGVLLASTDHGRSFGEATMLGYYEYRGTILWTPSGTVVITTQPANGNGNGTQPPNGAEGSVLARVSLDGGRTWLVEGGGRSTADVRAADAVFEVVWPPLAGSCLCHPRLFFYITFMLILSSNIYAKQTFQQGRQGDRSARGAGRGPGPGPLLHQPHGGGRAIDPIATLQYSHFIPGFLSY
jgi:hypothetical protein